MGAITVDGAMQADLERLDHVAEIRDRSGRLIGYFTPAALRDADLYRHARQHFDPEVSAQRKAEPHDRYSTAEVLDHVRSLKAE